MFKQASILVWVFLLAVTIAHADEKGTFMVQEGAFPWYDRVNNWALTDVPASLKDTGPLPRQSCSSRGLEIPGNPKVVTIGIANKDLAKFKQKFPATAETGEAIAVKNPAGTKIPYAIVTLPSPPAKIEGGEFGAGFLLLRMDGTAVVPAPPVAPAPVQPPSTPPQSVGDKMFMVQDGAFPWYDRATGTNTWVTGRCRNKTAPVVLWTLQVNLNPSPLAYRKTMWRSLKPSIPLRLRLAMRWRSRIPVALDCLTVFSICPTQRLKLAPAPVSERLPCS
jgi:hypothetical protein